MIDAAMFSNADRNFYSDLVARHVVVKIISVTGCAMSEGMFRRIYVDVYNFLYTCKRMFKTADKLIDYLVEHFYTMSDLYIERQELPT